jgi:hypothetical protein
LVAIVVVTALPQQQSETKLEPQGEARPTDPQQAASASAPQNDQPQTLPVVEVDQTHTTQRLEPPLPPQNVPAQTNVEDVKKSETSTQATTSSQADQSSSVEQIQAPPVEQIQSQPQQNQPPSEATELAKKDLANKIQQVMLESTEKTALVNWYTDPDCQGELKTNGVLAASRECQYLSGYPISSIKSASAECSHDNTKGVVTFWDTTCVDHEKGSNTGRQLTVALDSNCVAFPGEKLYAKLEWCHGDSSSSSTTPSLFMFALATLVAWMTRF